MRYSLWSTPRHSGRPRRAGWRLTLLAVLITLPALGLQARAGVVYSGYLAGRNPREITAAGNWSNPSTLFPFSGVNTTSAELSQTGDWGFHIMTRSEVQNTTISVGELQEATAKVEVHRVGTLAGGPPFPTQLEVRGYLDGAVTVGTNSFHDGFLTFGPSSIESLDDLFFPDSGQYSFRREISMIVPVDADGRYNIDFAFSSSSWGRVGVTAGDFSHTLQITSILLADGSTPESHGFAMTFDDGSSSPNPAAPPVPEPNGLMLLGIAAACLAGLRRLRLGTAAAPTEN